MTESHPIVLLARRAIEGYVRQGIQIEPPAQLDAQMPKRAGAFVTIHRHGQLRGCIGTIQPVCETLVEEVIENAISAASRDPRFPAVRNDELDDLEIKVDVLGEPEEVFSEADLDPARYGLIIQSKAQPWKRGLLLPDLPGIDTVERQVSLTRVQKAGITDLDEPVEMYRFEVSRYS
jgi:hypothetical protein